MRLNDQNLAIDLIQGETEKLRRLLDLRKLKKKKMRRMHREGVVSRLTH